MPTRRSGGLFRASEPLPERLANNPTIVQKLMAAFVRAHAMKLPTVTSADIRRALLLRKEIALLDLRFEVAFATGHPLFAANMAVDRIAIEAAVRLPRKDVPIVLFDDDERLVAAGAERLAALGYSNVRALDGG